LSCRFAATNLISSSSGRLSTIVPSVRTHGSSAAINRAPPFCIEDGPSTSVFSCGVQFGDYDVVGVVVGIVLLRYGLEL
jgi:hypothetical protein